MSATPGFPALLVEHRTGSEPFRAGGEPVGPTLLDFWSWAYSDLANNAGRGVLAEFLVGRALGAASTVRAGWDAFDVMTPSGLKLEVKSSSPWQSWFQKSPSLIQFGIRPTREWSSETNELAADARRQADIYIFAVLDSAVKTTLDPLNLDQWQFYLLPAKALNERFPEQKMLTLKALRASGCESCGFATLASTVEAVGAQVRGVA